MACDWLNRPPTPPAVASNDASNRHANFSISLYNGQLQMKMKVKNKKLRSTTCSARQRQQQQKKTVYFFIWFTSYKHMLLQIKQKEHVVFDVFNKFRVFSTTHSGIVCVVAQHAICPDHNKRNVTKTAVSQLCVPQQYQSASVVFFFFAPNYTRNSTTPIQQINTSHASSWKPNKSLEFLNFMRNYRWFAWNFVDLVENTWWCVDIGYGCACFAKSEC